MCTRESVPGPYGEVRNGGLPDWLLTKGPTRVNDPVYLSYVRKYYEEVGRQLKGLLWKNGGPVIGVQLENEYSNRAPNGGRSPYIEAEKHGDRSGSRCAALHRNRMGQCGVSATRSHSCFWRLPDEFWSASLQDLPRIRKASYQFHVAPTSAHARISRG